MYENKYEGCMHVKGIMWFCLVDLLVVISKGCLIWLWRGLSQDTAGDKVR